MRWHQWLCLFLLVGSLTWTIRRQDGRITQLECALAQAHAEADTLEAMLEGGR